MFLVTKKEYVTCEGEEETPLDPQSAAAVVEAKELKKETVVKIEPEPAATKKTSPAQKTKQKSIMSFFTKK